MHGSFTKGCWDKTACLVSHGLGTSGHGDGSFARDGETGCLIIEAKQVPVVVINQGNV